MRLLIDCMPLTGGGGVQVAIAFLNNLHYCSDVAWQAVVPEKIKTAIPAHLKSDLRLLFLRKSVQADRLWLSVKLTSLEKAFAPDVVFTVFGPAYFHARAPHVVGFALPNLIYARDSTVASPTRQLEHILDLLRCTSFRKADHLVVETQTVQDRLAKRLAIDAARISVIANSVNPLLETNPCQLNTKANKFSILVPSAHYRHKNLEIIPFVAAEMKRIDPKLDFEFKLTLGSDSAPWRLIAASAENQGVRDNLTTLGVVPIVELGRAYASCSAVYLPTLREASTAVYPESFHFKRPLVTSDLDFARELCGDAAAFVPPLDAAATAGILLKVAHRPEYASQLVEAGKKQLDNTYLSASEKFVQQLNLLYAVARGKQKISAA